MNEGLYLTHGTARQLLRYGIWMLLLAISGVIYIKYGLAQPTIPAPKPFPLIPHLPKTDTEGGRRDFKYYETGRSLFALRKENPPTPYAVVKPKPTAAEEAKKEKKAPPPPPPPPPPNTTGLTLTGVALGIEGENLAMVEERSAGKTWMLQINQPLRNAVVVAIDKTSVTLETDKGIRATLRMKPFDMAGIGDSPSTEGGAGNPRYLDVNPHGPHLGISVRFATPEELKAAGATRGLYIYKVNPGVLLKVGDILLSLEKQDVDTVAQAVAIYRKNENQKELSVEYMRSGKKQTISIPLHGE